MRVRAFAPLLSAVCTLLFAAALAPSPAWATKPFAPPPEDAPAPATDEGDGPLGEEGELSDEEVLRVAFGFEPGPRKAAIGNYAELQVPEGFSFTGVDGTRKFLEQTGNVVNNRELATLYHLQDKFFIIFEFDAVGYVSDDDKDDLDADAMLESIREGTRQQNAILAQRGEPTMEIVGWHREPHYDETSHNLEWAPLAKDSLGENVVNYNVRLLGRRGVMEAALVAAPEQIAGALPKLRDVLSRFKFKSGEDYASFTSGDKVAEYGLTGLVAGGAVAVAAKSGLLSRIWKFLLVGVLALGGFVKKLFGGGGRSE